MPDEAKPPAPVAGDIIGRSTLKTIGGIAFTFLMLIVAGIITWAWFADVGVPLPGGVVKINFAGGIVAMIGLVIMPLMLVFFGFMLLAQERIVLGDDRLQILQRWNGVDKVTTQIPYRNIAKFECGNDEGVKFLGIDLLRPDDADTFQSGTNFAKEKTTYGWHFRLLGGYQVSLNTIHEMLSSRVDGYLRK